MRSQTSVWILGAITICCLLACSVFRPSITEIWADESTYLAMIASLSEDHDLRFDDRDLGRIQPDDRSRGHLILQRTENGITYSKPVLAALLAAPLHDLLGDSALIAVNSLALIIALVLSFHWLSFRNGRRLSALALFTFVGASVLLPYVVWRMSDSLQASFILIGLATTLPSTADGPLANRPYRAAIGCLLLGLTVVMRVTNIFLALIPSLALVFQRRYRRALLVALATATGWGLVFLVSLALTGTANPYRAERTTFNADTGYPAGPAADAAMERFSKDPARHLNAPIPSMKDHRSIYSALYFFAGRHTGILFYFPAALLFLAYGLRPLNSRSLAVLLGVGAFVAFYLLWKPGNYFGGSTFIGNRYFIPGYAALLFAPRCLPATRALSVAWIVALLAATSALYSQWAYEPLSRTSQGHTLAGLFRAAPFETTGQYLDGRRDRYWAGHLVTFSDPFADPQDAWFDLVAGNPATEMSIVHWERPAPVHLRIECHVGQASLEVRDWTGSATYPLTCPSTELLLDLGPPWRFHGYWWNLDILQYVRTLRLQFIADQTTSADGTRATARIIYLGIPADVERAYSYELVSEDCPRHAIAGTTSTIELKIRNTSRRIWKAEDTTALRYVHWIRTDEGISVGEGAPQAPARDTAPGEVLVAKLEVTWPSTPSEVELSIDLELDRIGPFRDRFGTPVFTTPVSIIASTASPMSTALPMPTVSTAEAIRP